MNEKEKHWIITRADGVWFKYYDEPPFWDETEARVRVDVLTEKYRDNKLKKFDLFSGTYDQLVRHLHDVNKMYKGK